MAEETTRRTSPGERRREREASIIRATRELFDARGLRDAQIDDIAHAVGINRAIIYRHFTGKEELFALTLTDYLKDLDEQLAEADDESASPEERLRRLTAAFADFGIRHPAFVDCGVTIMRMGPALLEELSSSALFRLGRGMTGCLSRVRLVVRAGVDSGDFQVEDPDLVANLLYSLGLGGLQLARLGHMVREAAPGVPEVTPIDLEVLTAHLMESSLALVRARAVA